MYNAIVLASLALASVSSAVLAGPHGPGSGMERRRVRVVHRRHHHRALADSGCDDDDAPTASSSSTAEATSGLGNNLAAVEVPSSASTGCTNGAWQCVGTALQICDHAHWVTMANCAGTGIVCSASGAVGCIWASDAPSPSDAVLIPTRLTSTARPSATGTATPANGGGDDEDDDDCDEYEDDDTSSSTTTPGGSSMTIAPRPTSVVNATQPTIFTTIGQGLLAGGGTAANATSSAESSGTKTRTKVTKTFGTPLTATATATATTTGIDFNATLTDGLTATVTATATGKSHGGSANITSTATSTGVGNATISVAPLSAYSAPHWVIYSDYWLNQMPSVAELKSYNRFILAFWMSNSGPVDNALNWVWMDADYRAKVLKSYHAAGIALMVSAFGSTDAPTTWGYDAVDTAQKLAAYVIEYQLDGVDIDYEDMSAMNSNQAEAWLIPFQRELRRLLPSPYIISHAPVAPWFTSANDYESGAYVNIHNQVGSGIDFYNVQFYNQGDGVYTQCETLLFNSGSGWPSTSVMEMNSYAKVPLEKIVIGKPLNSGDAANGYMSASDLAQCVSQAQAKGWNAGVMFWEWTSQAPGIMATVRG